MAHPSTPAGAIAARLFRAAVLSVASLLLSTCARDVTAPPAPTQLAFLQQPENLLAGHQFSQTVKVRADDAHGNKVASFTGNVTVALANNPGGATLSGTTTVAAVDGIATFSDLSLDKTGAGYTLTASASGGALVAPTSGAFDVAAGPATQLVFSTEPRTTVADHQISPAVKVRALDALGNPVPSFTGSVSIAAGNNPGGATLSGTTPVAAVSGVATFFDLSLNKTGTGYTLTASASGFAPVTSTAFDVTPGTATQLAFAQQPSTTVAGAAISPAVQVTALDAAENPVPGFTGSDDSARQQPGRQHARWHDDRSGRERRRELRRSERQQNGHELLAHGDRDRALQGDEQRLYYHPGSRDRSEERRVAEDDGGGRPEQPGGQRG